MILGRKIFSLEELSNTPTRRKKTKASKKAPIALLLNPKSLTLPPIVFDRHKYLAGYVLGIAGSHSMPGAAALSSLATLRSGAGLIRLFTHESTPRCLFAPEVICENLSLSRILEEMERSNALFIGPGLGRTAATQTFLRDLFSQLNKPVVLDGDALFYFEPLPLSHRPILTPHRGEMTRLLSGVSPTLENCTLYTKKHQVIIVLKGAPTIIFYPDKLPLIIFAGGPGMATAGSGDVLTGIIASLIAQKMDLPEALALAVHLHGAAGNLAALEKTPHGMIASDMIDCLPLAFMRMGKASIQKIQ